MRMPPKEAAMEYLETELAKGSDAAKCLERTLTCLWKDAPQSFWGHEALPEASSFASEDSNSDAVKLKASVLRPVAVPPLATRHLAIARAGSPRATVLTEATPRGCSAQTASSYSSRAYHSAASLAQHSPRTSRSPSRRPMWRVGSPTYALCSAPRFAVPIRVRAASPLLARSTDALVNSANSSGSESSRHCPASGVSASSSEGCGRPRSLSPWYARLPRVVLQRQSSPARTHDASTETVHSGMARIRETLPVSLKHVSLSPMAERRELAHLRLRARAVHVREVSPPSVTMLKACSSVPASQAVLTASSGAPMTSRPPAPKVSVVQTKEACHEHVLGSSCRTSLEQSRKSVSPLGSDSKWRFPAGCLFADVSNSCAGSLAVAAPYRRPLMPANGQFREPSQRPQLARHYSMGDLHTRIKEEQPPHKMRVWSPRLAWCSALSPRTCKSTGHTELATTSSGSSGQVSVVAKENQCSDSMP